MTDQDNAREFVHAMIQPLIPYDPSGIEIRVKGPSIAVLASQQNMGSLIGRQGAMVKALRQLVLPFGWVLTVPSVVNASPKTPALDPIPDVRDLVLGWLDARYNATGYRLTSPPESDEWEVYVHPDHFTDADYTALDTWAWGAARAQGQRLKVRLIPGGILYESQRPQTQAATLHCTG